MRIVLFTGMILASLLGCAAPASDASSSQLDALFSRLRTADSADEAHHIEMAILRVWVHSGQSDVDALMLRGLELANAGDLDAAMPVFDRIIELAPNFAEAYNQRAQLHVLREEYPEAVIDIEHVLALEPRHFGALTGLGHILELYGQDETALRCYDQALAINPYLDDVRDLAESLRQKLRGVPI
ncbi:MAG TPA: tetratricopeptide repeat protein [Patescibacteria group bacterium]|nr:tetratricopeptide repeat protein [Patescibacteria group bacterium]